MPNQPRRGRRPNPGGRIPQSAARISRPARGGRSVVRIVDAGAVGPTPACVAQLSIPDFDPAKDGIFERQMVTRIRDQLRNAASKLELREEEVTRLGDRNAYPESELKLQERHLTNALKDNIMLKQKLALKPGGDLAVGVRNATRRPPLDAQRPRAYRPPLADTRSFGQPILSGRKALTS
jgi:hypothetical protein